MRVRIQSRRASFSFAALLGLGAGGLLSLLYLGYSLHTLPKLIVMNLDCPLLLAMVEGRLSADPAQIFPWIGFGLLFGGLLHALTRAGKTLLHVNGLKDRLFLIPAENCPRLSRIREGLGLGFELYRFQGDRVESVFTMGFRRPKVCISAGLCTRLSDRELEGVILHEAHHVRQRDPLRQFITAFIHDFLFFFPLGGILKDIFADSKEKAADDTAADGLKDPLKLASALLKLAAGPEGAASLALAGAAGDYSLTLQRIERLMGIRGDEWPGISPKQILGTGVMGYLLYICL